MCTVGGAFHGEPDLIEGLENIEASLTDGGRQRLCVGTVAIGAVLRHTAGLRRIGDQGAFRRAHLGEAAARGAKPRGAERIVSAGVEDQQVELGPGAVHLTQHEIDVDHLEIDIRLSGRIGADGNEVVRPAHLHAMAGVIE